MGAATKYLHHPACPPAELKEWFNGRCQDERSEHGWDPYSGSLGTKLGEGLDILSKVFANDDDAYEYLGEQADKRGPALAAKVRVPSKATALKIERMDAEIKRIQTVTEAGAYRPKAIQAVYKAALERARWAKSKTKGCAACGSAIARTHICSVTCPVCGDGNFLITATDSKRIKAIGAKQTKGEEQIQALLRQQSSLVEADTSTDYRWCLAACCPE